MLHSEMLCHQFPHTHFKKHDIASLHACSTTPTNMSLIDHVMTEIVLI